MTERRSNAPFETRPLPSSMVWYQPSRRGASGLVGRSWEEARDEGRGENGMGQIIMRSPLRVGSPSMTPPETSDVQVLAPRPTQTYPAPERRPAPAPVRAPLRGLPERITVPAADGFRAFAALSVVLYHC